MSIQTPIQVGIQTDMSVGIPTEDPFLVYWQDFLNATTLAAAALKGQVISCGRASQAYRRTASGIWEAVSSGQPRFHHSAAGVRLGLGPGEPAATNIVGHPIALNDADWTKTRSSVTLNSTTAPDGNASADTLVEDATASATHVCVQAETPDGSSPYTWSFFAKAKERSQCRALLGDPGYPANAYAEFDVSAHSILATGAGADASGLEQEANSWDRAWVAATSDAAAASNSTIGLMSGGTNIYNGDGASGEYFWGTQLEQNPFPSTIVLAGSRNAEAYTNDAAPTELTTAASLGLFLQLRTPLYFADDNMMYFDMSDGSNNNRVVFYFNSSLEGRFLVRQGGSNVFSAILAGPFAADTVYKIAARIKADDMRIVASNSDEDTDTDTSDTMPFSALDQIMHLDEYNGGQPAWGYMQTEKMWVRDLSDNEMNSMVGV